MNSSRPTHATMYTAPPYYPHRALSAMLDGINKLAFTQTQTEKDSRKKETESLSIISSWPFITHSLGGSLILISKGIKGYKGKPLFRHQTLECLGVWPEQKPVYDKTSEYRHCAMCIAVGRGNERSNCR